MRLKYTGLRVVGLVGIRSISRPPLKVQKVGGLYRRGCRREVRQRDREEGEESEGEKGHVPRVPRLRPARHRQCGSRQRLMSLARTSASRCTWHHSPLGERRWNEGVAILRTRPLVGPRNTVSRLGTHGRDIDGPR